MGTVTIMSVARVAAFAVESSHESRRGQPPSRLCDRRSRRRRRSARNAGQDGSADASAWEGELHAAARLIGGAAEAAQIRNGCVPALKSGSIRDGKPTGAIRAIPACLRHSISAVPGT